MRTRPRRSWSLAVLLGLALIARESAAMNHDHSTVAPKSQHLTIDIVRLPNWTKAKEAAQHINNVYAQLIDENGPPPKPEELCSGQNWTQNDEGFDVSGMIVNAPPKEQKSESVTWYAASYHGDPTPIAIMGFTVRNEPRGENFLYIRYLVSKPKSGGGQALIKVAFEIAERLQIRSIQLEAAKSASVWYQSQGFIVGNQACHNVPNVPCGCMEMEWRHK